MRSAFANQKPGFLKKPGLYCCTASLIVVLGLMTWSQSAAAEQPPTSATPNSRASAARVALRRPVALALSSDSSRLYTANRSSGTVSVIDVPHGSVAGEIEIGGELSDLAVFQDNLLVVDRQNHQVVLLGPDGDQWSVAARLDVAHDPVCIELDREAQRGFVSSLWSRTVTMIDLSHVGRKSGSLQVMATVRLPFEPQELCLVPGGKRLVVVGAFQSTLAVVHAGELKLASVRETPGQSFRGLAIQANAQRILATQQALNPIGRATRDDVHWGNMLSNQLVSWPLDALGDDQRDLLQDRTIQHLGEPGNGAGDPGPICFGPDGEICIVLSGVNEVAIGGDNAADGFRRVAVGRRPVAAVTSPTDGCSSRTNSRTPSRSSVSNAARSWAVSRWDRSRN